MTFPGFPWPYEPCGRRSIHRRTTRPSPTRTFWTRQDASVESLSSMRVPRSPGGAMRNIWPCGPPASPSAPAIGSSAGRSRSWRPPAPGSARKSARSGRAPPSTDHCGGKSSREKQLSRGLPHPPPPIQPQWDQREVGDEEGWSTTVWALQKQTKKQQHHPHNHCWEEEGHFILSGPEAEYESCEWEAMHHQPPLNGSPSPSGLANCTLRHWKVPACYLN